MLKVITNFFSSRRKSLEICKRCVYYNGHGGCWARKGPARYGAPGCDFREVEE